MLSQKERDLRTVKKIEEGKDLTTLCIICGKAYNKLFGTWVEREEYEARHPEKEFYYSMGVCNAEYCREVLIRDYGFEKKKIKKTTRNVSQEMVIRNGSVSPNKYAEE